MYLIDSAAEKRSTNPIQVAVYGAGFLGAGLIATMKHRVGLDTAIVVNRTAQSAVVAIEAAGLTAIEVETAEQLRKTLPNPETVAVTSDPDLPNMVPEIEAVVEITGTIDYAAKLIVNALQAGKHVVNVNAEIDAYVGPRLLQAATENDCVYTVADGDQPGAQMNLIRYVRSLGGIPRLAGSVKGLLDHYRTPETQAGFAATWKQTPEMVTSFADGTKIAFEQAVVANATGFEVTQLGMSGPTFEGEIEDVTTMFDVDQLRQTPGVVDYVIGASPGPGVFVLAEFPDKLQHHYLRYLKMGDGPLYSIHQPHHLCHLEVPNSIIRAVEFGDATIAPTHGLKVDVVASAKRDLSPGDTLDGLGGFDTFGQCENAAITKTQNLLPIASAEGCTVTQPVKKGDVISRTCVKAPEGRYADRLRSEIEA